MAAVAASDPSAGFGQALRDYRRAAGLTQEELAERAGVSPRSISGFERGTTHIPRRDTIALLIRALGLVGADRDSLQALVDRRRTVRPVGAAPPQAPPDQVNHALERPMHNLPRSLNSFIGREHELGELTRALAMSPLLTLTGAGGVGKTRLAQELIRTHAGRYADGCWLVELAGLSDPALVARAVGAAVGLRDFQARNIQDTLTSYLQPKELLLALDNCEHLVEAVAVLVAHLLRTCPNLGVLATSREPLAIAGETTWQVLPLELPDARQRQPLDQIARVAAVRLFTERAHAANNTLVLTEVNAPAIARICIGVDGIPLGLELAAARTRVLTVEQLAERLERDVAILSGADRATTPRHRTIRAMLDWSHALLGEPEQILLRRLSVFASGWMLDSAEEVCAGGSIERGAVLELLGQLVDKSMVLVDARGAAARYRLLEPVRQYAAERLRESGEADSYRARHAAALLELAQTGDLDGYGSDEIAALERFEVENANLRAALRWALTHNESHAALRASAALFRFWERRGHFQEGCAWLEEALIAAADAPPPYRGRALNALAFLYWRGGNAERAQSIAERALEVNQGVGDTLGVAWALGNLGMTAFLRHDHEGAVARLEEGVQFARRASYVPLLSLALTFLGRTRMWVNGPHDPRAAAVLQESLALAEQSGSLYATGHALATLGDLFWGQSEPRRAIPLWRRALSIGSDLADRRAMAGCLERLALVLAASDRLESAAWLFGAADAEHKMLGIELRPDAEADHAHFVAVTRQHLGEAFGAAWSDGQAASLDQAVARALDATECLPSRGVDLDGQADLARSDPYEFGAGVSIPRPQIARPRPA
jgi:predicted ATPase/transcriptional regulator with XRE-family HTH domain